MTTYSCLLIVCVLIFWQHTLACECLAGNSQFLDVSACHRHFMLYNHATIILRNKIDNLMFTVMDYLSQVGSKELKQMDPREAIGNIHSSKKLWYAFRNWWLIESKQFAVGCGKKTIKILVWSFNHLEILAHSGHSGPMCCKSQGCLEQPVNFWQVERGSTCGESECLLHPL